VIFPTAAPLVLLGLYLAVTRFDVERCFFLVWILGNFAMLAIELFYSLRYLAPALLPSYLLAADGFAALRSALVPRLGETRARSMSGVVFVLILLPAILASSVGVLATIRAHQLRVAPFRFLEANASPDDLVLGVGTLGCFHYRNRFFDISQDLSVLGRIVPAAMQAHRILYVVLPLQSGRAENEFEPHSDARTMASYIEQLGGERVWEGVSDAPIRGWLPPTIAERMREAAAVYRFPGSGAR
jgi:hypothetical protein